MGGEARKADNVIEKNPMGVQLMQNRGQLSSNPGVANLMADYGLGKTSLKDALGSAQGLFGKTASANAAKRGEVESRRQGEMAKISQARASLSQHPPHVREAVEQSINKAESDLNNKYNTELNDLGTADEAGMMDQFQNMITTNPLAAQRYGTDELRSNPLTAGLFGEGGIQEQAQGEAKNRLGQMDSLINEMNSGEWQKLNENDNTIYGQMLGNLARQTAGQEQALSQSLADRGLAAAPSGAAIQGVSGIMGNKMEGLAQMQQNLIQQKMNNAMNTFNMKNNVIGGALGNARQTATNMGALGQSALSNLFNRNMAGRNTSESELANANNQKLQNQQAYQGQLNTGFAQEEATRPPSFGEVVAGVGSKLLGGATEKGGSFLGGKLFGN